MTATATRSPDHTALPNGFHWLDVAEVRSETLDASSVAFVVPPALREVFTFESGQYLTLLFELDGEPLRRPYSICVPPGDEELRVCVKRLPGGRVSGHVTQQLRAGDRVAVMVPAGRFRLTPAPAGGAARRLVGIAGGSGITPVLSILRTVLRDEPDSHFTLLYGNRSARDIIFAEQLAQLKDQYLERLQLVHVLAGGEEQGELFSGLLDSERVEQLLSRLSEPAAIDSFYICGPGPMMDGAREALSRLGVEADRVKIESFGAAAPVHAGALASVATDEAGTAATATVIVHGKRREIPVPTGSAVLDAALAQRLDLPYACKGGVCCTCKAKLIEGEVEMAVNYGLEAEEIARGFILTCQARPTTETVVIDYDAV